jgi:hypothetical protein
MKKYCLMSLGFVLFGVVAEGSIKKEDMQELQNWIKSQNLVAATKGFGGELSIKGDTRIGGMHANTWASNEKGRQGALKGHINFDLSFDYKIEDKTWLTAVLSFNSRAGLINKTFGSGTDGDGSIDTLYMGYRVLNRPSHTLDVELGRKGLSSIFTSKLQGNANLDGIVIKDSYKVNTFGDLSYQLMGGIVNVQQVENRQWVYGLELSAENIRNTGAYAKYSLVNWDTDKNNLMAVQFKFLNSQLFCGYKFTEYFSKTFNVYALGVMNHKAKRNHWTLDKNKDNFAVCVGFVVGETKKAGDWSLELNGQLVGAQAISDLDLLAGNGLGNVIIGTGSDSVAKSTRYFEQAVGGPVVERTDLKTLDGNGNYLGYRAVLKYLLKDNLTIYQRLIQAKTWKQDLGLDQRYLQYKLELVYSF